MLDQVVNINNCAQHIQYRRVLILKILPPLIDQKKVQHLPVTLIYKVCYKNCKPYHAAWGNK